MLSVGDTAPDFSLQDENGDTVTLSALQGRMVMLIFYPGDETPVCTKQLCDYRDNWTEFQRRNVILFGVNPASMQKHKQFAKNHSFPFPLLADTNKTVCKKYDASGMFGMTKRAYTIIDANGKIAFHESETLPVFKKTSQELLKVLDSI